MGKLFLLCSDFPFFILIPSGRILKDVRIRSRIEIAVTPSILAFLVSNRTRLSTPWICSSAESSIVITRSSDGIYCDSALRNVVFPDEVPPEINMLYLALTRAFSSSAASIFIDCNCISFSMLIGSFGNLRMDIADPSRAIGDRTMCTREPSASLVSTIGEAWFTTRLCAATIC